MTTQFKYCSAAEATIARALVDAALAKGYSVTVNDGEETTVRSVTNRDTIFDAMNTTDHDWLIFKDATGKTAGSVMVIWGNGSDLISDHTDNDAMHALTAPWMQ